MEIRGSVLNSVDPRYVGDVVTTVSCSRPDYVDTSTFYDRVTAQSSGVSSTPTLELVRKANNMAKRFLI